MYLPRDIQITKGGIWPVRCVTALTPLEINRPTVLASTFIYPGETPTPSANIIQIVRSCELRAGGIYLPRKI